MGPDTLDVYTDFQKALSLCFHVYSVGITDVRTAPYSLLAAPVRLETTFIPMTLKNITPKNHCFLQRRDEAMGYGEEVRGRPESWVFHW